MLNWLKRRGAPKSGPDYQHVTSREKAEELSRRGELTKVLLLPSEFGGQDVPQNVVYVPAFAAELKARLDKNTIKPLAQEGKVSRYTATPEYEGRSVVPSSIRITAEEPSHFEGTISIWGKAVEANYEKGQRERAAPAFSPLEESVDALGPEDLVRAFIADYERWNTFAHRTSCRRDTDWSESVEAAYATLIEKYCPSGHKSEPVAFGSDSSHDIKRERIVSVDPSGDGCVVRTRHIKDIAGLTISDDFEYHLIKSEGRWFLVSILYVAQDGKYEGL